MSNSAEPMETSQARLDRWDEAIKKLMISIDIEQDEKKISNMKQVLDVLRENRSLVVKEQEREQE